jgi:hypothetical protein
MLDALTNVHLWTNPILCLPLLQLARVPRAPIPEPAGVRPIKVLVITPRRGLILTVLISLAFAYFLDATILVVDLLTSPYREITWENIELTSWIVYSFGGFLVWSLAAILSEWRTKWGDGSLALLGALGFIGEVANLPLLIKRETHYGMSLLLLTRSEADCCRWTSPHLHYPFHCPFSAASLFTHRPRLHRHQSKSSFRRCCRIIFLAKWRRRVGQPRSRPNSLRYI